MLSTVSTDSCLRVWKFQPSLMQKVHSQLPCPSSVMLIDLMAQARLLEAAFDPEPMHRGASHLFSADYIYIWIPHCQDPEMRDFAADPVAYMSGDSTVLDKSPPRPVASPKATPERAASRGASLEKVDSSVVGNTSEEDEKWRLRAERVFATLGGCWVMSFGGE